MKTSTAVSTSILTLIVLFQVCPAPPVVLGPILIAAGGAVGGTAIATAINHPSKEKRADEFRHSEQRAAEERNERWNSGMT